MKNVQFTICIALVAVVSAFCSVCAAQDSASPPVAEQCNKAPAASPQATDPALTVDQLLDNMETARKKLKTFRAEVVKERVVEVLELTETSKGNIQFKMPRLLRLQLRDMKSGEETILIVGPEYAWIVRPDKNQAKRGELRDLKEREDLVNPLEYGLAKDIHKLRDAYDLTLRTAVKINGRKALPLELDPKGGMDYVTSKFVFWIDAKIWLPVQVREFQSNGEIIETHTFSEIRTNPRIRDDVFLFTPPKDMDVDL